VSGNRGLVPIQIDLCVFTALFKPRTELFQLAFELFGIHMRNSIPDLIDTLSSAYFPLFRTRATLYKKAYMSTFLFK
jgi:hypothetical protein